MELKGLLKHIYEEKKISDKFTVKEFVLTVADTQYPQHISFQISNKKIELLDPYKVGDEIKVQFDVKGREWINKEGEAKYFNSLNAWKIELLNLAQDAPIEEPTVDYTEPSYGTPPDTSMNDQLPF